MGRFLERSVLTLVFATPILWAQVIWVADAGWFSYPFWLMAALALSIGRFFAVVLT